MNLTNMSINIFCVISIAIMFQEISILFQDPSKFAAVAAPAASAAAPAAQKEEKKEESEEEEDDDMGFSLFD